MYIYILYNYIYIYIFVILYYHYITNSCTYRNYHISEIFTYSHIADFYNSTTFFTTQIFIFNIDDNIYAISYVHRAAYSQQIYRPRRLAPRAH